VARIFIFQLSKEFMNDIVTAESGTVALLNKGEIDMQIATAHRYPRSIKKFREEALQMVTLNETIAQECIYSLPRDGKNIEGPSARFAEVIVSGWGNSRAGARVVSDQGDFVTAQAVFHDLEKNVAITYEVQRRIVNKNGQRFKPDMIGVTANAACSIALRNAILKGVPKAFWSDLYDQARQCAIGDVQTLANRRARALAVLQKMGVQREQVFAFLEIAGEEDMTLEHLGTLFGITTAIKDGDTTPEQAFSKTSAAQVDDETLNVICTAIKSHTTIADVEQARTDSLKQIAKYKDDTAIKIINETAAVRKTEIDHAGN
jgi:hypothetical protein